MGPNTTGSILVESRCYQVHPDTTIRGNIPLQLQYDPSTPYQVTIHITGEEWQLSRDLLEEGLHSTVRRPAGEGEIRIWQHRDLVYLSRGTQNGNTKIVAHEEDLTGFLLHTHLAVPPGNEKHEISHEDLEKLLAG